MISWDICERNMGCINFVMEAYDMNPFVAEHCFQKMQDNGITGEKLYMLWNDCCDRDTNKALAVMDKCSIEFIKEHINYERGRGIPIASSEVSIDE